MNLTEHFTLEELTHSDTAIKHRIDNIPIGDAFENLVQTAEMMEEVRVLLGGKPITITSGYRSPALNSHPEIGGALNSDHTQGRAADFICPEFGTPHQICKFLEKHMNDLGVHQLIHEFGSWVHIAHHPEPANMALTIDVNGTRHGFT